MKTIFALACFFFVAKTALGFGIYRKAYPKKLPQFAFPGTDPGKPLFLSPLIEAGEIEQAQNSSRITLDGFYVSSFSGFFTVNKTYNSNMFFWFVEAKENPETAPVAVWLQGGPGVSSLFGMFNEHGPYSVSKSNNLEARKYAWTNKYSMLYIDNPVGTGFSFTDNEQGYSTNEDEVAENLYSVLFQFFTLFPKLQKNDFYVMGESYAGKFVPAIGSYIHITNPKAIKKINFKGVAMGDGLCDPESMVPAFAELMYQVSLLDENQKKHFEDETAKAVQYIKNKEFKKAFNVFDVLMDADKYPYPPYIYNVSGVDNYYNFLRTNLPPEYEYFGNYLQMDAVRKAIHVGNLTYHNDLKVEDALKEDLYQSVKDRVVVLANNYKIMFYNGQLDIIVGNPLTQAFLQILPWKGLQEYKNAKRLIWKVDPSDTQVAGYVRQVNNFYQVVVRNAGHILPFDQPRRALDMIERFIEDKPFA